MAGSPTDTTFTILYFAAASSYTNKTSERLPAPLPVLSLFSLLETRYPGIEDRVLKSCAVTVNLEYVDVVSPAVMGGGSSDGVTIGPGDEVGIIPPVSSG